MRVVVVSERNLLQHGLVARLNSLLGVRAVGCDAQRGRLKRVVSDEDVGWFVVDADLFCYDPFGLLVDVRVRWPSARRLLLLGTLRDVAIERGMALGVEAMMTVGGTMAVLEELLHLSPGRRFYSEVIASRGHDADGLRRQPVKRCRTVPLTLRECEVLHYLATGRTVRETAELTGLSSRTIDNHKSRMSRRLGVRGQAELTDYAVRHGVIPI